MGRNNTVERFVELIYSIKEGETIEFMCHPGSNMCLSLFLCCVHWLTEA